MRCVGVPNTCGVWWEAALHGTDLASRDGVLSEDEWSRADRLRRPADRANVLTAWILAREVLGQLASEPADRLVFSRACAHCGHPGHGKPRLVGSDLDFSLSHSGHLVALVVSDQVQVGIDLEQRGTSTDGLAAQVLHPDERAGSDAALLRTWVRKEAVLKSTGHGLAVSMQSIHLGRLPSSWKVHDVDVGDNYWAAVATVPREP